MQDLLQRLRKMRSEKEDKEQGFTLIELLVVVVIIGILIAIAIPLYLNYENGAKNKSSASDLRGAISTIEQCYTDNNNTYPTAITGTRRSVHLDRLLRRQDQRVLGLDGLVLPEQHPSVRTCSRRTTVPPAVPPGTATTARSVVRSMTETGPCLPRYARLCP